MWSITWNSKYFFYFKEQNDFPLTLCYPPWADLCHLSNLHHRWIISSLYSRWNPGSRISNPSLFHRWNRKCWPTNLFSYNTFGNGYYPSSSYLFNAASYPTVVSHYLYVPGGNPWEPGRNFIDLRVNPYPWYLGYYGGLGTGFGSTTFPGTYETFGSSLGYPTGSGGFLNNGLTGFPTAGFPTGYNFGLSPSYNTFTGNLGFGNYGYPGTGVGGYYPTGNLGGQIHRSK